MPNSPSPSAPRTQPARPAPVRPRAGGLRQSIGTGQLWIWLTGAALSVCLLMIAGLLLVVMANGLGYFWPHALVEATLDDSSKILGVRVREELYHPPPAQPDAPPATATRTQFKLGNRDIHQADFRWIDNDQIQETRRPANAVALERVEYGDFHGYLVAVRDGENVLAEGDSAWPLFIRRHAEARKLVARAKAITKHEIGRVNHVIEAATLDQRRAEFHLPPGPERDAALRQAQAVIDENHTIYESLRDRAAELEQQAGRLMAVLQTADGTAKEVPLGGIVRPFRPNAMGLGAKLAHYASKVWEFVSAEPRESNTEGGIFPAIFGTVFMTLIMSVAVVPFGVVAAFYLREYAKQGPFVRAVRIAVNNLAGVPSIVFGVFGLGFFVYFVGGTLDQWFHPEKLPTPTYGTGGILWASLTLALLTVPVVIVATEESIASVPRGAKEGSLALGASKFQTLCRIVLPASLPGILTGLILAVARGAGEVAPLMITGVVKLAPDLPLDGQFPFVHLDRKFMHLGFHIYDVGFQSPNVEAAKPMVFTTALLLLVVVALLNITAICIRDHIRKKYKTGAFA